MFENSLQKFAKVVKQVSEVQFLKGAVIHILNLNHPGDKLLTHLCIFPGDPVLPGVEWQSENPSLYLHPGETELSHHRDQLQAVCAAGGRRRTDLSAQQHFGGGEFGEIHSEESNKRPAAVHLEVLPHVREHCRRQLWLAVVETQDETRTEEDTGTERGSFFVLVPNLCVPAPKVPKPLSLYVSDTQGRCCGAVTLFNHSYGG